MSTDTLDLSATLYEELVPGGGHLSFILNAGRTGAALAAGQPAETTA